MSLTNLIIALVICFLVGILFLVYKLYLKTVDLRQNSSVMLMKAIKSQNSLTRILKKTNKALKTVLIVKKIWLLTEAIRPVSFLFCLVSKKR